MKATGIVRRIDDLGRVVIPKEIRRTMRIREGDPLEIYTNNDGEVIFKKYSPINELGEGTSQAAEVVSKLGECPVIIFDRDHVVAVAGASRKEYMERRLSHGLEDLLESRKVYVNTDSSLQKLCPVEGINKQALAVYPIISSGDITGAVALLTEQENEKANDSQKLLAQSAAMFLGKQIEE
ncbi:MAG: stage V sporulation T C-terminal domain-containing protein [Oscillospiraceae bacterium]